MNFNGYAGINNVVSEHQLTCNLFSYSHQAPAEEVKPLYLQYAKLEEDYGLAKRAMSVYDQAVRAVPDSEKLGLYEIYIRRASEIFGLPKTREIYQVSSLGSLSPSMSLKHFLHSIWFDNVKSNMIINFPDENSRTIFFILCSSNATSSLDCVVTYHLLYFMHFLLCYLDNY